MGTAGPRLPGVHGPADFVTFSEGLGPCLRILALYLMFQFDQI